MGVYQMNFWNKILNEYHTTHNRRIPEAPPGFEESLHQLREMLHPCAAVCFMYGREDNEGKYIDVWFVLNKNEIRHFIISESYVFDLEEEKEFHRLCFQDHIKVSYSRIKQLAREYGCLVAYENSKFKNTPKMLALIYHHLHRNQAELYWKAGLDAIACNLHQIQGKNLLAGDIGGILSVSKDVLRSLNSEDGVKLLYDCNMRNFVQGLYLKKQDLFKYCIESNREKTWEVRTWNCWMVSYCRFLYELGNELSAEDYKALLVLYHVQIQDENQGEDVFDYLYYRKLLKEDFPELKLDLPSFRVKTRMEASYCAYKTKEIARRILDEEEKACWEEKIEVRYKKYGRWLETQNADFQLECVRDLKHLILIGEKFKNCLWSMPSYIFDEPVLIFVLYQRGKKRKALEVIEFYIQEDEDGYKMKCLQTQEADGILTPDDKNKFLRDIFSEKNIKMGH